MLFLVMGLIFLQDKLLQLVPAAPKLLPATSEDDAGDATMASAEEDGSESWLGDIFLADGAEGIKLSEVKKALADAGEVC